MVQLFVDCIQTKLNRLKHDCTARGIIHTHHSLKTDDSSSRMSSCSAILAYGQWRLHLRFKCACMMPPIHNRSLYTWKGEWNVRQFTLSLLWDRHIRACQCIAAAALRKRRKKVARASHNAKELTYTIRRAARHASQTVVVLLYLRKDVLSIKVTVTPANKLCQEQNNMAHGTAACLKLNGILVCVKRDRARLISVTFARGLPVVNPSPQGAMPPPSPEAEYHILLCVAGSCTASCTPHRLQYRCNRSTSVQCPVTIGLVQGPRSRHHHHTSNSIWNSAVPEHGIPGALY